MYVCDNSIICRSIHRMYTHTCIHLYIYIYIYIWNNRCHLGGTAEEHVIMHSISVIYLIIYSNSSRSSSSSSSHFYRCHINYICKYALDFRALHELSVWIWIAWWIVCINCLYELSVWIVCMNCLYELSVHCMNMHCMNCRSIAWINMAIAWVNSSKTTQLSVHCMNQHGPPLPGSRYVTCVCVVTYIAYVHHTMH